MTACRKLEPIDGVAAPKEEVLYRDLIGSAGHDKDEVIASLRKASANVVKGDTCLEAHGVIASCFGDDILPTHIDVGVIALPATELVVAEPTFEDIIAVGAGKSIVGISAGRT